MYTFLNIIMYPYIYLNVEISVARFQLHDIIEYIH